MSDAAEGSTSPKVHTQSIEAALLYCDLIARSLLTSDPETHKNLDDLRKTLCRDAAADYANLTSKGCDGDQLLWYLSMLSGKHCSPAIRQWFDRRGPGSLPHLIGLNSRQLKAFKKKLLDSAAQIERTNSHFHFGVLLHTPHLKYFWSLPTLLRGYASLLTLASERIGRGTHLYHNYAKAALIAHVRQRTRQYCDGSLSGLIAAVTGEIYSEVEHHNWRNQHSDLIASIQSLVLQAAQR